MATSKVPVIVTILLLGRGTMTYKRIHLIEGEPITLKVWDVKQQAGRQARLWSSSCEFISNP